MKTDHAIKIFGTPKLLAEALGITVHAIYQWGEDVPLLRVYQIKELKPEAFEKEKTPRL